MTTVMKPLIHTQVTQTAGSQATIAAQYADRQVKPSRALVLETVTVNEEIKLVYFNI